MNAIDSCIMKCHFSLVPSVYSLVGVYVTISDPEDPHKLVWLFAVVAHGDWKILNNLFYS